MIIAIDFDGSVCKHRYPYIGDDIGAIPILKKLIENDHYLVLNTMRSGKELQEAVQWLRENNIELFGVNKNPTQHTWTTSPKVFANYYIDDMALGCPLIKSDNEPSYIDWEKMEILLKEENLI